MSPMTGAMFKLRNEPGLVVIEAYGHLGADEAGQLRDLALLAVANNQAVVIDLEQVKSLTAEAADALLFRGEGTRLPKEAITVRTGSRPARTAVLEAYAHRRGRRAQA
jgi:hypothetical protein